MSHQERVQKKAGPAPVFHPMRQWRAFCYCDEGGYQSVYYAREAEQRSCPNCRRPMLTEQVKV